MGLLFVLTFVTGAASAGLANAGRWEVIDDNPERTIERRVYADGFYEFRVSVVTPVAGSAIADAYWNERKKSLSTLKKYVVLKRTADEKVSYLQLRLPIVKDRDYTIRIVRYVNLEGGLYQFSGKCITDAGPPPNEDHVRVTQCSAELTIEPTSDGRTVVTYVAYANPAGQLPKWLMNSLAPKAAIEMVETLIEGGRTRGPVVASD